MKNKLIVISGPSGVGKKTIWSGIMDQPIYKSVFSVSMTTRKKRPGEKEGKDYFFVTKKQFENAIKTGKMLEWATYVDNYYGTPKAFVQNNLKKKKNVFLEIETQGVLQVIKNWKEKDSLVTIFIAPPSLKELKKRLINRKTESINVVNQRLLQAKKELKRKKLFKYVIINDTVEKAKRRLTIILNKELQCK